MGLSSSQARLLNLTARMHQIEYKAAKIEAMKLQMANESTRVYNDYLDALEKTKVQVKSINSDGSASYVDINDYAEDFIGRGFAIDFNGVVYDGTVGKIDDAGTLFVNDEIHIVTGDDVYDPSSPYYRRGHFNIGDKIALKPDGDYAVVHGSFEDIDLSWSALCADAFGATSAEVPNLDVKTVIINLINSGMVTIVQGQRGADGKWVFKKEGMPDFGDYETSVATNTGLQEVNDESDIRKAEAKYEADMKRIDMKDRKFDTDLAAIDNERNAIKQEMETLKTVARDNVERTFKLFS